MRHSPPTPIIDYASPAAKPSRGAWWLVKELLAGVVLFVLVCGVFWIGASFWWSGPVGQSNGALDWAVILVPIAIGVAGWILLAVLLRKALREWRT